MEGIKKSGLALMAVLAGLMLAGTARADEGITVQGNGTAKAKPTQVEIECTLNGDAELASDATVKFRDAKKRALAAIAGMKNPDVTVTSEGIAVSNAVDANAQMMAMRGGGAAPGKPRVQIVEKEHIILANADKLDPDALMDTVLKVLDVAKDAGFQMGSAPSNYMEMQMAQMMGGMSGSLVTFKLPDGTSLRDQAYKAALEDAKAKAQKLAELSGVKLGKVISIQESSSAGKDAAGFQSLMMSAIMGSMGKSSGNTDDKSVTGTTTGELTKHMSLSVQFEIVK